MGTTSRTAAERQQQNSLFRLLVESIRDYAIFLLDPNGHIMSWNEGARRLKGYEAHEVIGKHFSIFYLPEDIAAHKPETELKGAAEAGRWEDEGWRVRKDGSLFWANAVITALRDRDGQIRGFAKVTRDFTNRREVEQAFREQAALLDLAHDAILVTDLQSSTIRYWNRGAEQTYGWSQEEALGKVSLALLQTRFPQSFASIMQQLLNTGHWEGELEQTARDGRPIVVASRWVLQRDAEGRPSGVLEINRDITPRKKAEAEVRAAEGRFRRLLAAAPDAMVIVDSAGKIALVNAQTEQMFGYTQDELLGQPVEMLLPERFRAAHVSHRGGYQHDPRTRPMGSGLALSARRRDGSEFPVEVSLSPLETEGGLLVTAAVRDITERRQAEEALAQRTEELARSNADLEQFAYVASHDLQEPLRAVVSYLQLLERRYRGHFDEKGTKYLDYAVDGARRMQSLIQDLLAYSRVGRKGEAPALTDVSMALEYALTNLRAALESSGGQVTAGPLPVVTADGGQLVQLFQNLISNALKFRSTAPPRIQIAAEHTGEGWHFTVQDNGIGIAPEYRERIFVIFQRLHGREEYPGTGIGLAICKRIIERHGGHIWVESTPGQGATFHFTIPDDGRNDA